MNARRVTPWAVIVLLVCGTACLAWRLHSRYAVQMVQGDSVWRLTYNISFHAAKSGLPLHAAVPRDTVHCRVFRQELRYSGLNTDRLRPTRYDTREFNVSTQRSGDFHLSARFDIHISPHTTFRMGKAGVELSAAERARYLRSTKSTQAESPVVLQTLERLQENLTNKDELLSRLYEFCRNELVSKPGEASDAARVLTQKSGSQVGRARALVALCRAAKMPARLVAGFEIRRETTAAKRVGWVEVLPKDEWLPYDPDNGFERELPPNFLAARHDGADIIHAPDVSDTLRVAYSLVRLPAPGSILGRRGHQLVDIFDLTRLRLEMHEVLSLMLLIPLGALVTTVFRTLIGVRTFGTFTPTLLALSFVYSDWRTGLVVFVVVVGLGLIVRALIDRLKLLMVPRLSVILTLVVVCIVFSVSILDYYHLTPTAQAVLLPMVIVTSTIERFYVTTEEDGPRFAIQLMSSTVVLAFLCYLVLRWEAVGRLLLTYPECHFFTLAMLLLIGRYTGYRLTELWRFRDFASPRG